MENWKLSFPAQQLQLNLNVRFRDVLRGVIVKYKYIFFSLFFLKQPTVLLNEKVPYCSKFFPLMLHSRSIYQLDNCTRPKFRNIPEWEQDVTLYSHLKKTKIKPQNSAATGANKRVVQKRGGFAVKRCRYYSIHFTWGRIWFTSFHLKGWAPPHC